MSSPRDITHRYIDPLAQVWLGAARRIGLRIRRTPDAYAATDGAGTLAIGVDSTLDPDDSLAQMIFHELCHSLVEGEASFTKPDWGMDNTGPDHDWREHACLRVQYVLAGRHGLRTVFAPTTDFRTSFWNTLSGDVLADRTDPSVQAAILALRRANTPPWSPALGGALAASEVIARAAAAFAPRASNVDVPRSSNVDVPRSSNADAPRSSTADAPRSSTADAPRSSIPDVPALWSDVAPARAKHPSGLHAGDAGESGGSCGTCAWRYEQRGASRCRQVDARVDAAWPACERYEAAAAMDCQTCGACCRAAYHSVEVSPRDPVVKKQAAFVVDRGTYLEIRREGDRCSALQGGGKARYHCVIYDDRPKTCRDFTLGSAHCLTARRRVGLSL